MERFARERFKISEQRLNICRECPNFNHITSQCSVCKCIMNFKTLLHFTECPVGKWGKWESPENNGIKSSLTENPK